MKNTFTTTLYASMQFSVKELLAQGESVHGEAPNQYRGLFLWKSIFGAPVGGDVGNSREAAFMNTNPEIASYFRASLLMHIEAFDEEKPIRQVNLKTDSDTRKNIQNLKLYDPEGYYLKAEFG